MTLLRDLRVYWPIKALPVLLPKACGGSLSFSRLTLCVKVPSTVGVREYCRKSWDLLESEALEGGVDYHAGSENSDSTVVWYSSVQ